MQNKITQSNDGRIESAPVKYSHVLGMARCLADLVQDRLALPTREEFAAAYALGLDRPPIKLAGVTDPLIELFDPTCIPKCKVVDQRGDFSPEDLRRLGDVLERHLKNPNREIEETVRQGCNALGRVPLGCIFVTPQVAESEISVDAIYEALLNHRGRSGEPGRFRPGDADESFMTQHHDQDGIWPDLVIKTDPRGVATLIALPGDFHERDSAPGCN